MTNQLEMENMPAPARPVVNDEILKKAAQAVALLLIEDNGFSRDDLETLTSQIEEAGRFNRDGYNLAKELDRHHGWEINASIVENLDTFDVNIWSLRRKAEMDWAEKFNIQPPYEDGTRVKIKSGEKGTITGVSPYDGAKYLVKIDGDPQAELPTNSRRVVNFEDCEEIKSEPF